MDYNVVWFSSQFFMKKPRKINRMIYLVDVGQKRLI